MKFCGIKHFVCRKYCYFNHNLQVTMTNFLFAFRNTTASALPYIRSSTKVSMIWEKLQYDPTYMVYFHRHGHQYETKSMGINMACGNECHKYNLGLIEETIQLVAIKLNSLFLFHWKLNNYILSNNYSYLLAFDVFT